MLIPEEKYMLRCLQLAEYGKGFTAPNPMVGAVLVYNGRIIGEGFHRCCGGPHAEVHAVASVKDEQLLRESTLYVNLEPCSHYGKTPPCAKLIIDKQISRVVIGHEDPFPEVAGRGIRMLQDAGVEVVCGFLREDCEELNKRFLTFFRKGRPYIFLKWAQSSDGFLDRFREPGDGQNAVRFSNVFTRMAVHKMRAEESAIMVGKRTEMLDNPQLNVRYWSGNDPLRLIADSRKTLYQQLNELKEQGIQSLIVEGGAALLTNFIQEGLWDEAQIEVAFISLGAGVRAPRLSGKLRSVHKCENSIVSIYKNEFNP